MKRQTTSLVLLIVLIFFSRCSSSPTKNGDNNDSIPDSHLIKNTNSDEETLAIEGNVQIKNEDLKIEEGKISGEQYFFMDKVYYKTTQTDTGIIIYKYLNEGFEMIRFSQNQIHYAGLEEFIWDIDSVDSQENSLVVYFSSPYDPAIKTSKVIETDLSNAGYMNMFGNLYVDSLAAKSLSIVQEAPYDIEEAIGDFPTEDY